MEDKRYTGCIKWFNTKAGYGFIKIINPPENLNSVDLFVHHSSIQVEGNQYKYLVQGEYVEMTIATNIDNEKEPYQAKNVTGICGNKLMCETNNELRQNKIYYEKTKTINNEIIPNKPSLNRNNYYKSVNSNDESFELNNTNRKNSYKSNVNNNQKQWTYVPTNNKNNKYE